MSKSVAAAVSTAASFSPTRAYFHVTQNVNSLAHARDVFKTLGKHGDMIEYKFMRCPETFRYLRFGFVVYKNSDVADAVFSERFLKVDSPLFDSPCEIKVEKSKPRKNDAKKFSL